MDNDEDIGLAEYSTKIKVRRKLKDLGDPVPFNGQMSLCYISRHGSRSATGESYL